MGRIILFDVNETLLDLGVLRPHFERLFGEPAVIKEWFARLLHASLVVSLTDSYSDFGSLAEAELALLAARQGISLSLADRKEIVETMAELPPHPEVVESLETLRSAGFRMATLTNSPGRILSKQMSNAGLTPYFERLLSVDETRRFKPAPETYRMAAERLGAPMDQLWMIAAHDWDVHGAIRAGGAGAFIARPGRTYHPAYERPQVTGRDLTDVVKKIKEIER